MGPPGWKSIPGLLKKFTNTGSVNNFIEAWNNSSTYEHIQKIWKPTVPMHEKYRIYFVAFNQK
jgi:hypothetical protein